LASPCNLKMRDLAVMKPVAVTAGSPVWLRLLRFAWVIEDRGVAWCSGCFSTEPDQLA
jgi:hypothetical protein